MDQFEDDLKRTLRRVDPPAGFDQRVMAKLNSGRRPAPIRQFAPWAAAAGLAVAFFGGMNMYQEHRQEQRALEAREKLALALQVTARQLEAVRGKLNLPEEQQQH